MANTSINIRMDAELKRQFEAFCADMGFRTGNTFGAGVIGKMISAHFTVLEMVSNLL